MRIGITGSTLVAAADVGRVLDHAEGAAAAGLDAYWLAQHPAGALDALTTLAAVGMRRPDLPLGTAVVPVWGRHPATLAAQALTTAQLTSRPFTLGIGLSHRPMVQAHLGGVYTRPVPTMREYLEVLVPLVTTGSVDHRGEVFTCTTTAPRVLGESPRVLVAAMGERMLQLAGGLAHGTITAWTGPKVLRQHVVPLVCQAAEAAGKPAPSVAALFYVCVTDRAEAARTWVHSWFGTYGAMPSYDAMVQREGASSPADVAIIGAEDHVRDRLAELAEIGVTDLVASEIPAPVAEEHGRTRALLARLALGSSTG